MRSEDEPLLLNAVDDASACRYKDYESLRQAGDVVQRRKQGASEACKHRTLQRAAARNSFPMLTTVVSCWAVAHRF